MLSLLGWHWLIRSYRFGVFVPLILDLYIALCTRHLKSDHLLSLYIRLLSILHPSYSLSSGNLHIVVCVRDFQFYIPRMSEIIWFVASSVWGISLSIKFSRSIHVTNGSTLSFLIADNKTKRQLSEWRWYLQTTAPTKL